MALAILLMVLATENAFDRAIRGGLADYVSASIASGLRNSIDNAVLASTKLAADPALQAWLASGEPLGERKNVAISRIVRTRDSHRMAVAFVASNATRSLYSSGPSLEDRLSEDDPADAWFFDAIDRSFEYALDLNRTQVHAATLLFVNSRVMVPGTMALAGVGIELDELRDTVRYRGGDSGAIALLVDVAHGKVLFNSSAELGPRRDQDPADNPFLNADLWTDEASVSELLQASYLLRSERQQGSPYRIIVAVPEDFVRGYFTSFQRTFIPTVIVVLVAAAFLLFINQWRLTQLAYFDAVTKLPLWRRIVRTLGGNRAYRSRSILVVQILNLRELTATLDSELIDVIIKQLGIRVAELAPRHATVARGTGLSFVVSVQTNADWYPHQALSLATELRSALSVPVLVKGRALSIQTAIGLAPVDSGQNIERGVSRAWAALAGSQSSSRLGIGIYDEQIAKERVRRRAVQNALAQTSLLDELDLVFQPIVDLRTGAVQAYEALTRWSSPDVGPVHPEEFIPLAEESGRIIEIGRNALARACEAWRLLSTSSSTTSYISVNVSPIQLTEHRFADWVEQYLERAEIAPAVLALEITESALVAGGEHISALINRLRALGVQILIDDFGVDHSSFGRLALLQSEAVKVDRSFIAAACSSERAHALFRGIVQFIHALGITAIVEGIETEQQVRLAIEAGADYGQGYLFQKPGSIQTCISHASKGLLPRI